MPLASTISTARKPSEVSPPRMGALAKLPVFLDLAGRRAIVAGGSAPAAWKAELLAAAGADVEIIAAEIAPEMEALLERGAAAGTLTRIARSWTPEDLTGAAIALADAADEAEALAFAAAARAAFVPVNIIDKPEHCQFQFGSIVNRSPVVVAISTDGAAPILAQAIRRRIETLLPASLADWGRLAKSLRAEVAARLKPGQPRRAFWERFAERAFAAPAPRPNAGRDTAIDARQLLDEIASEGQRTAGGEHARGRVTLVGAGPGDAELLTLKAVRALQSADVILFDDLVSDEVLELARREAKRMLVGKRGKRASCSQADINALMIKLASQGRHVVRLKSGDPMIFGRAGEEIAELEAAGIPVSVVPGITAGIALAASLGVSLTHRDLAQSVRFVTGHARNGELPADLDWRGLADPATTLIFYMGGRTARSIAQRLTEHGLDGATPVVVASGIGRPDEQRWTGQLSQLATQPRPPTDQKGGDQKGGDAPVLIGIGRALAQATRSSCDEAPARPAPDTQASEGATVSSPFPGVRRSQV